MNMQPTSSPGKELTGLQGLLPDLQALYPTLETGVETMVVGALAWLAP